MSELNISKIRISGFVKESIVDGFGLRYVIFTQGCLHECPNCHNQHTWSLLGGTLMNIQEIIDDLANYPLIAGITLSGGEPFLQAKEALILAKEAHKLKLDVITYTGFTYEEILCLGPSERALLDSSDYLIDGPYLEGKKSLDLAFRGSSNQRIIDLTQTRKTKKIVLLDEFKNPILS